ncbi:MAG: nucleoside-diphosphate kinase [Cyanobacteria bacterium RYN_339]|nr:nucleoside-diphosphate kinase [Cyanobacteria bacterium RYN_339]
MTFTMVTPDAMLGGYLRLVLNQLGAAGFAVRAHRLTELDWDRLSQMYTHLDDPPPSSGDEGELPKVVMERLYRLAPACILILEGTAEAMLALKGATRPAEAAPGTIRAGGEHLIFNFVHCPDDAASAAIELAYLVGPEDAKALWASPGTSLDQLHMCVPAYSGWEAISFPMVANRLRSRFVERLEAEQALPLLVAERQQLLTLRSAAERLHVGQAASPAIHRALVAAAAGDAVFTAGLEALAELYKLPGRRDQAPLVALRERGIYLSELEQVTLHAHARAFGA